MLSGALQVGNDLLSSMNAVPESVRLGRNTFDVSDEVVHVPVEFLFDLGRPFLTLLLRHDVLVPAAEVGRQFLRLLDLHIRVTALSVDDALVHFVRALNSHLLRLHLIILGRQPVYEFLVKVRQMETYTNDFEKLVALAMDTELLRIQICQDLVAR